jgi:hypothetical protein
MTPFVLFDLMEVRSSRTRHSIVEGEEEKTLTATLRNT